MKTHVKDRMLPSSHVEVQSFMRSSDQGKVRKVKGGKWQAKHAAVRSAGLRPCSRVPAMPLRSARELEVWQLACARGGGSADIIVDLTQGIDRIHPRSDGVCPTIAPRGCLRFGVLGRPILACEELFLHGVPLHRVSVPWSISDVALGRLGGNTMRLHCVGFVMLVGPMMLRDIRPASMEPPPGRTKIVCINAASSPKRRRLA